MIDILSSVYLVNNRLRYVSLVYSRFRLDFNLIGQKKKQFTLICSTLFTFARQIVSLTFEKNADRVTTAKIVHFVFNRLLSMNYFQTYIQLLSIKSI